MSVNLKISEAAFTLNAGHLLPYQSRCKGLYLFGGSEIESVKDRSGNGNDLTYVAGAGGVTYGDNYVDFGALSKFQTPFTLTPRNLTVMQVLVPGFYEEVYDGDLTYRWPPTVSAAASMRQTGSRTIGFGTGFITYNSGANQRMRFTEGPDLSTPLYINPVQPIGFQDATWQINPYLSIGGHGPDRTYGYWQCNRGLWYSEHVETFGGAAPAAQIIEIENSASQATGHQYVMAFAAYEYLTPAEALVAGKSLAGLVEARGWEGFSKFAVDG